MRILIGTDGSPNANAAVKLVTTIRWPADSRFLVVTANPIAAHHSRTDILRKQIQVHRTLATHTQRQLRDAGLQADVRVATGDPGEVILQLAKTANADLIVVGSQGHSGLSSLLMGSVAKDVVAHSPCSVLVVKQNAARSASGDARDGHTSEKQVRR